MSKYNIYIICKNEEIFNKKKNILITSIKKKFVIFNGFQLNI